MTSKILCAPQVAGLPTHLQTWEGYETLELLQEEIQAGPGREGDACSDSSGKARKDAASGGLAATTLGEDHVCQIESWILRQVMVRGVGLPSPSTPWPSPLTLPCMAEARRAAVLLLPLPPSLQLLSQLAWTQHTINILTFACTHTPTRPPIFPALHVRGWR